MAAPLGNQNALKGARWTDAINRALDQRSRAKGIEALDELAETLLMKAESGDISALKELGDRIQGKAAQAVILQGDEDNPVHSKLTIELIRAADSNLGTP